MALGLLATTDTQIIRVVEALYNQRPGYTLLSNYRTFATENGIDGFANALAASFASSTDAELAAIVTANLGLTGDALAGGNAYLEGQFAAAPAARGAAILAAMNLLSTLENDATFGAIATSYNADVTASLTYSTTTTNTAVTASDAAADAAAAAASGQTFTLTTGTDGFTGTANSDTFSAGEGAVGAATLTAGDTIDGGAGTDTINFIETDAITALPTGTTITNVENFTIIGGADVTFDSSSISGVTALNVTTAGATGDQTLTAAATTDVTSVVTAQANQTISIQGGKDISGTYTGATTSTITIGGTTAPTGAITTSKTLTYSNAGGDGDDDVAGGTTAVTGGTTQSITQSAGVTDAQKTAALTVTTNDTVVQGNITATGGSATTAITVTQDATVVVEQGGAGVNADGRVGITAGTVTIADTNAASATAAGTLTTVTLANFGNSTIDSSALTTVNLSGTGGTLDINRGALTATPTENTLALTLTGATTGAITDEEAGADNDDGFTTIALTGNTTASTVASLVAADATTLTASGDAKITLTAHTMAALTDITVTNTGGLDMDGTALGTAVNFTGGAGADAVSLGSTTKAITMGAGDDIVTTSTAAVGTGGSVDAGEGTGDKIIMTNALLAAADNNSTFNSKFTNFEVLQVSNALTAGDVDLDGINGVSKVILAAGATTATIGNIASGGTVQFNDTDSTGTNTINVKSALTGTTDSLNLAISNTGDVYAAGTVTVANVETINITASDANTSGSAAAINTMTLTAAAATNITVSGNNGMTLTATDSVAVTSFDASGVVANDTTAVAGTAGTTDTAANLAVTYTSVNATTDAVVTITGSVGNDTLTGSAAAVNLDTINGGAGDDTIDGGTGVDTLTGGEGADTITGGLGADSIILTETTAASDAVVVTSGLSVDTITGFTAGATAGDDLDFDISVLEGAGAIIAGQFVDLVQMDDGATAMSGTGVVQEIADQDGGAAVAAGTDAEVFVLVGETYASASAVEDGLEFGDHEITIHDHADQYDALIVLWSDGTDAHYGTATITTDSGTDWGAGDLTVTQMGTILGVGTITAGEFVTGNFDII